VVDVIVAEQPVTDVLHRRCVHLDA